MPPKTIPHLHRDAQSLSKDLKEAAQQDTRLLPLVSLADAVTNSLFAFGNEAEVSG